MDMALHEQQLHGCTRPSPMCTDGTLAAGPACISQKGFDDASSGSTSSAPSSAPVPRSSNLLAELAGFLGFGGDSEYEKDPVEPFTLYGTVFKKYMIEDLDGEKVVGRRRGFTVDSCVSAIQASRESPQFQGLPTGEKVRAAGNTTCRRALSTEDLRDACSTSCGASCSVAMDRYVAANEERTGYQVAEADQRRVLKACTRSCAVECSKPGRAFDFVATFRR